MHRGGGVLCLDAAYSTTRRVVALTAGPLPAAPTGSTRGREEGGLRLRGYGKAALAEAPGSEVALVSIITVVRNGERHLEAAIRSVLDQEYDNVEYILVDGASTDGTVGLVRRYEHAIDYWVSEPDAGIYEAMNKGIALATGDVIGILNADDQYGRGILSSVAQALAETRADYTYGSVVRLDAGGREASITYPLPADQFERRCVAQGPFPHPSLFVRRGVYERIGGFDTGFRVAADRDFIARMIRSGHRGVRLQDVVAFMRSGGVSDGLPRWSESRRVARKHGVPLAPAYFAYLTSVAKIGLARALPRLIMKRLLRLKGSRHHWIDRP